MGHFFQKNFNAFVSIKWNEFKHEKFIKFSSEFLIFIFLSQINQKLINFNLIFELIFFQFKVT